MNALPENAAERKAIPLAEGCLYYFPAALAEVARVSKRGNDQHNPGQPMHHARGKSTDHADCIMRHLVDAGSFDTDGMRHSAKVAWRALALLQDELERNGAPIARNARLEVRGNGHFPENDAKSPPSPASQTSHPMHAEALRMAEERIPFARCASYGGAD